jgi:hypothetical protein
MFLTPAEGTPEAGSLKTRLQPSPSTLGTGRSHLNDEELSPGAPAAHLRDLHRVAAAGNDLDLRNGLKPLAGEHHMSHIRNHPRQKSTNRKTQAEFATSFQVE